MTSYDDADLAENPSNIAELAVVEGGAVAQAGARGGEGGRIAVDADQLDVGGGEDRGGVARSAEGAIAESLAIMRA